MKTNSKQDYLAYKAKYESISGLLLPYEYLANSDVYVFKNKDEIIGGFILGFNSPLRTVETFVSEINILSFSNLFQGDNFCEVCCFWINKSYRKNPFYNSRCWLEMAYAIRRQPKDYILFGTKSKGLAKMYNYPKASELVHKDNIGSQQTYIFLARRNQIVLGTCQLISSKLFHRSRYSRLENKFKLKNSVLNELSR